MWSWHDFDRCEDSYYMGMQEDAYREFYGDDDEEEQQTVFSVWWISESLECEDSVFIKDAEDEEDAKAIFRDMIGKDDIPEDARITSVWAC